MTIVKMTIADFQDEGVYNWVMIRLGSARVTNEHAKQLNRDAYKAGVRSILDGAYSLEARKLNADTIW
jgi:methanogenic corrinoid protein MtbC1